MKVDMIELREAIEASWDEKTSYRGVVEEGNPALGQCYPTSRIIQSYFPEAEIVEGQVKTRTGVEKHFWNLVDGPSWMYHIDFTWQQFPPGSHVVEYKVRDRNSLGDGDEATSRVQLLGTRVASYLAEREQVPQ